MGGCATRAKVNVHDPVRTYEDDDLSTYDDRQNLELYYLFWLDSEVTSPEHMETVDELRSIINYLKVFGSREECRREFQKVNTGKIFLIANCDLGLSLLPNIHDHENLYAIYMYQTHDYLNINDIKDRYQKVRDIYDSLTTAKRYLEDDVKIHTDLDDPIVMDIITKEFDENYEKNFNLFVKLANAKAKDVYDSETREQLLDMCVEYYADDEQETDYIARFSDSYKAKDALSWYTPGAFLHRLLSRAFTDYDMTVLVHMYSFIVNINQCIKTHSEKQSSPLRVFRAQLMSNQEFSLLEQNINQIITMQCFFSARTSCDDSKNLLSSIGPVNRNTKSVLFEIDALQDYTFVNTDESSTSKTVLFMLGTTFKITSISGTTVTLVQYISNVNGNYDLENESAIVIRGILTYLKSGATEAIKYFKEILSNPSEIDLKTHVSIYGQLGYLEQQLGNLNVATKMYEKAVQDGATQFDVYLFYLDQAAQHYAYGLGDWEKATSVWTQKLNFQKALLLGEEKAQTYENLANASLQMKEYNKANEYITAAIESLPEDHPRILLLQNQLENMKNNSTDQLGGIEKNLEEQLTDNETNCEEETNNDANILSS